jgi:hypothetical protein
MTRAQRQARYRQLHRQQTKDERYWQPRIYNALVAQLRPFLQHLKTFGVASAADNLNSLIMPGPLAKVIEQLYVRVGVQNANSEYGWIMETYGEELRQEKAFGFNKWFADLMRTFFFQWGAERVTDITETERRRIQKVLDDAAANQLDNAETARRIRNDVVTTARSRVIARTENAAAANYGTMIGAKRTGVMIDKVWISVNQNRTRRTPRDAFDHLHMSEKRVAENEQFAVPMRNGGVEMMPYPCFPGGSAGNVCNCRCRAITEARRGPDGKLIRIPVL